MWVILLYACTPHDRLADGNRHQPCRNASDQQTAPRGGLLAFFISPKEQPPHPENGKDHAGAAQRRGQMHGK